MMQSEQERGKAAGKNINFIFIPSPLLNSCQVTLQMSGRKSAAQCCLSVILFCRQGKYVHSNVQGKYPAFQYVRRLEVKINIIGICVARVSMYLQQACRE